MLAYYPLGDGVTAFSTTRRGGVSTGLYGGFNVNAYCGDKPKHVAENRRLLCQTLDINENSLILPHQVHGIESRQIAAPFFRLPEDVQAMLLEGIDSLLTDVPGVCIGVSTADCIPILMYDPVRHVTAAVHAGWRGTLSRIVCKTVKDLRVCYDSRPADLRVVVGPGISLEAFEVGEEVYDHFAQAGFDMNTIARKYTKWHLDLPECNRQQLIQSGIRPEYILNSNVCTYHRTDLFFSARRLGTKSGRIFSGILFK